MKHVKDPVINGKLFYTAYIKKNGTSFTITDLYHFYKERCFLPAKEVWQYVRDGIDLHHIKQCSKSVNEGRRDVDEFSPYLKCLLFVESEKKGDSALLSRIIRAGGFIEYAKKLEELIGDDKD